MALPPRVERHLWLRFDTHDYLDSNIQDFKDRLAMIYDRQVHRVHILDFDVLTEEMDQTMTDRLRMEHTSADRQLGGLRRQMSWRQFISVLGLHTKEEIDTDGFRAYWTESLRVIASKDDLRDYWTGILLLAPEKVTNTDLFYLRSMDRGTMVNVLYLLAQYLFRFASGRKQGSRMFGGHFVARLGVYFGLGDVVTWVAMGLERQQVRVATKVAPVDPEVAQEGVQADLTPTEVSQMPQTAGLTPSRVGDRLFATWMIGCMTQLMDANSLRYQEFDGSFVGSSQVPYQRRGIRQRTDGADTLAAPQTQPQPDP
ncbi:hypothetical protein Tco_1242297 [Tanacetum coccineum]